MYGAVPIVGKPGRAPTTASLVTNNAVQSLAIDPRDPRIVFGGTQYGLFKTVDGGASWSRLTNVLPEMSGVQVAVSGQDPDTVWTVGSDSYSGRHGLDDSADGGNSWAAATGAGAPDSNLWSGLAVSPADSATVYASDENGLYRTDYGGASWTRLGVVTTGIVHGGALAISPVDPARLYLNTYFMTQTLYVSGDAGATWGEAGGLAGGDAYTVVPDPTEALYAYASTPDGLYRSTDGGAHWNRWIAGPPMNKIAVVATDAAPPAPNQPGSLCGGGSQAWLNQCGQRAGGPGGRSAFGSRLRGQRRWHRHPYRHRAPCGHPYRAPHRSAGLSGRASANGGRRRRARRPFFVTDASVGRVFMLDATNGAILHIEGAGFDTPLAVAVDVPARRVIVVSDSSSSYGDISVLDADSGRLLQNSLVDGSLNSVVVDERRGRAYATDTGANQLIVVDATSGDVLDTIYVAANAAALDESSGRLYVASVAPPGTDVADHYGNVATPAVLPPGNVTGAISEIDPATDGVVESVTVDTARTDLAGACGRSAHSPPLCRLRRRPDHSRCAPGDHRDRCDGRRRYRLPADLCCARRGVGTHLRRPRGITALKTLPWAVAAR